MSGTINGGCSEKNTPVEIGTGNSAASPVFTNKNSVVEHAVRLNHVNKFLRHIAWDTPDGVLLGNHDA